MNQIGLVETAGIVVVFCLLAWQFIFVQFVRPRLMDRVGRRLGVEVHESLGPLDAGLYDTEDSAPVRKAAGVMAADFVVTLAGTVGVFAAAGIPLLLLGDSGLPYRWEGQIMGTSARIGEISVPAMDASSVVATVVVRNESSGTMQGCRVDVADYRARDGYLTGASDWFDLAPGAAATVELPLKVTMRVAGTHGFRVRLECGRRLKDQVPARIRI